MTALGERRPDAERLLDRVKTQHKDLKTTDALLYIDPMITGVHTMFYSAKPEELRAFLRDKLRFPFTDAGGGWLIFDLPSADMGVHPEDPNYPHAKHNTHAISFFCDDIHKTVADL